MVVCKAPGIPQSAQSLVDVCSDPTGLNDSHFAQSQPYLFAWKLFLAINCPASKDPDAPRIWETWKPVDAVYRPDKQPPEPWGAPLLPRTLLDRLEIDGYPLRDKKGQPVLSEIRMNRDTFEYIVSMKLYNRVGQSAFFNSSSKALNFPPDAMEIKAAWLILDPNDPGNSRYYTIHASYKDNTGAVQPVVAGLASLHITSKVLPHWFWTTFEHVDNESRTNVKAAVPIPPAVGAANDAAHKALPGSVWGFYNLRGVQLDYTNPDHSPTILANTLLETRFQQSSSCITCHNLATQGAPGRLGFLNTTGGVKGYVGEVGDPSNHYTDGSSKPVCYDDSGPVFTDCDPSNPKIVYKTTDFVWSLKEAR